MTDVLSTRSLLTAALTGLEDGLLKGLKAAGYDRVTLSEIEVLRVVAVAPASIVTIADHRGVSKQAAQSQIQRLVTKGFAKLSTTASDKRLKQVGLTKAGRDVIDAFERIEREIEDAITDRLGTERTKNFHNMLGQARAAVSAD